MDLSKVIFGGKNTAFTLAEILITLTIIGVIAVITIPNLMHKWQQKELEAGFKKAYALLSNAVQKAGMDAGSRLSDYGNPTNLILQQLQVVKSDYYKNVNTANLPPLTYDGGSRAYSFGLYYEKGYYLNNGMFLRFEGTYIIVDTNGPKRPNRVGYDVFAFTINSTNNTMEAKKIPYLWNNPSYCSKHPTSGNGYFYGFDCQYYANINKNPDNMAKGYWESLDF